MKMKIALSYSYLALLAGGQLELLILQELRNRSVRILNIERPGMLLILLPLTKFRTKTAPQTTARDARNAVSQPDDSVKRGHADQTDLRYAHLESRRDNYNFSFSV